MRKIVGKGLGEIKEIPHENLGDFFNVAISGTWIPVSECRNDEGEDLNTRGDYIVKC